MTSRTLRSIIKTEYDGTGAKQASRDADDLGQKTRGAAEGTEKLSQSSGGLNTVLSKIAAAGVIAKIGQELLDFGAASIQAASDAEEIGSKFDTVFGEQGAGVIEQLDEMGDAMNRSVFDLKEMASSVQDTFVPMGFARNEAAQLSVKLTELAVDVASFNNAADADVMRDFQSALVGNTETVRKYGIVMTAANVEQEAYRMGLAQVGEELTEQQKIQARLQIIMQGTSDAQGDAIRTAESYANQSKGLDAALKELQVTIGDELIPALANSKGVMADAVGGVSEFITVSVALEEAMQRGSISFTEAFIAGNKYRMGLIDAEEVMRITQGAAADLANQMDGNTTATTDFDAVLQDMHTEIEEGRQWIEDSKNKLADWEEEAMWSSEQAHALEGGLDLLAVALQGVSLNTWELREAQIALAIANGEMNEAQAESFRRFDALRTMFDEGRVSLEDYIDIIEDGIVTEEELAGAFGDTTTALEETSTAFENATEDADAFGRQIDSLPSYHKFVLDIETQGTIPSLPGAGPGTGDRPGAYLVGGGAAQQGVSGAIAGGSIPMNINLTVHTTGDGRAIGQALQGEIHRIMGQYIQANSRLGGL